jgi:hypothetical protein
LRALFLVLLALARDLVRIGLRSRSEIIAENLFLRRQLALYQERKTRRRRPMPATDHFEPVLFVQRSASDRQTKHFRSLAPGWISTVLATEISGPRKAAVA